MTALERPSVVPTATRSMLPVRRPCSARLNRPTAMMGHAIAHSANTNSNRSGSCARCAVPVRLASNSAGVKVNAAPRFASSSVEMLLAAA